MAANIVPQKVEDVDTQALSPMMQQYLEISASTPTRFCFTAWVTFTRCSLTMP